jgi:two-component system LytT family sensor kinase
MQEQHSYDKPSGVLIHVLMWVVFSLAFFYYQPITSGIGFPGQIWIKQIITLSLLIITFYLNSLVLVPKFLFRNQTVNYFLIVIAIIISTLFIQRWVDRAFSSNASLFSAFQDRNQATAPGHRIPPRLKPYIRTRFADILTITISVLVVGISTTMTAIQKSQKDNQERKELEKDKITSELSFLKAQINPHFFFNTLNNIYVLTAVDPEVAGKAIHQLSKMMRYLLYDTQGGHTMLSQEIAFVRNYVSLMKLRLTDVVKINIDTPVNLQDMALAPMIFLPFIENAFKHGVSATQPSHIDIIISQKDKMLELTVNNSIMKDNSFSLDTDSGIGLENTRRRLDLLYPGKYKLEISDPFNSSEYTVHLVLDLS